MPVVDRPMIINDVNSFTWGSYCSEASAAAGWSRRTGPTPARAARAGVAAGSLQPCVAYPGPVVSADVRARPLRKPPRAVFRRLCPRKPRRLYCSAPPARAAASSARNSASSASFCAITVALLCSCCATLLDDKNFMTVEPAKSEGRQGRKRAQQLYIFVRHRREKVDRPYQQ